jgi:hypothetical protein
VTRARFVVFGLILLAVVAGSVGETFSKFTGTTTNANDRVAAQRIFARDRAVPAQAISDAVDGTAADVANPLPFADTSVLNTSSGATTFATNRYVDVELAGTAPAGLTPSTVTAEIDFGDNNTDAKQSCMYFESRRISTDAVLNTWGSAASPLGCNSGTVPMAISQPLTAVTSATIANDLKLRIYFKDEGANAVRLSRVNVKFVAYGKTWTLYPVSYTDALDTTPAPVPWGVASADGNAWQYPANAPGSYTATKSVSFGFPESVPGSGVISAASFDYRWSAVAGNQCFYFETYNGTTLLGTHGSTGSPYCTNSTTYVNGSVSLPEVDTPAKANSLTVKLYVWGGGKVNFDVASLHHTYQLGRTGCVDTGTQRIPVSADSYADQANATPQGGNVDLKVRSDTTKNKRTYLFFPVPSLGSGCSLTSASLRVYQNTAQSTRTIAVDRATGTWQESTLNWANQPGLAGTTATSDNAVGWHTWNVTSLVQAMYSATNYGFVLKDATEGAATGAEQKYDAIEEASGNAAELVLTFG